MQSRYALLALYALGAAVLAAALAKLTTLEFAEAEAVVAVGERLDCAEDCVAYSVIRIR